MPSTTAAMFSSMDEALAAQASYEQLTFALQQQHTLPEYRSRVIVHSVSHGDPYAALPSFVRSVLTEKRYAELTISIGLDRLQVYPYHQIHVIVEHTHETPLSYYTQMLASLLKAEKSYDALPNFTAVDILQLLGIGRNQFLNTTKEARSKLWWRVTRSMHLIRELLPKELLPTAALDPFCEVWLADPSTASGFDKCKRLCEKEPQCAQLLAVWRRMQHRWKSGGMSFVPQRTADASSCLSHPSDSGMQLSAAASSRSSVPSPATDMSSIGFALPAASQQAEIEVNAMLSFDSPARTHSQPESGALLRRSVGPQEGDSSDQPTVFSVGQALEPRPFFYSCELPKQAIHTLYRKGLVYSVVRMDVSECVAIPPLENFVMNRTSDDPQETLLYNILSTIDDGTNIDLLSQLLSLDVDRTRVACELLVRLGLAKRLLPSSIPDELALYAAAYMSSAPACLPARSAAEMFSSPSSSQRLLAAPSTEVGAQDRQSQGSTRLHIVDDILSWGEEVETLLHQRYQDCVASTASAREEAVVKDDDVVVPLERSEKRIALLYDAGITGILMMTNLSADPTFKHHAVTLFEAGKLTDDALRVFETKLLSLQSESSNFEDPHSVSASAAPGLEESMDNFSGEATKYLDSALCLGRVLRMLHASLTPEVQAVVGSGVDMRKVEALNELEAKTRYLVLGRKYLSFFGIAPLAIPPLIDLDMDNLYTSSVALQSSPWMLIVMYNRLQCGPPSVFLPLGTRLTTVLGPGSSGNKRKLPSVLEPKRFFHSTLRVLPLAAEAEITYANPHTCLLLLNACLVTAPLFLQRTSEVPKVRRSDGSMEPHPAFLHAEVHIPMTANDTEVLELALEQLSPRMLAHRRQVRRSQSSSAGGAAPPLSSAAVPSKLVAAPGNCLVALFRRCVRLWALQHSVGYFTFALTVLDPTIEASLHDRPSEVIGDDASTTSRAEEDSSVLLHQVFLVEIGFGFPIGKRVCCNALVQHVPLRVLHTPEQVHHHSEAMKQVSRDTLRFMADVQASIARPSSQASCAAGGAGASVEASIRKLALGGAEDTHAKLGRRGPSNQRHLRNLGHNTNLGSPFPEVEVSVDAHGNVTIRDEWDPLAE